MGVYWAAAIIPDTPSESCLFRLNSVEVSQECERQLTKPQAAEMKEAARLRSAPQLRGRAMDLEIVSEIPNCTEIQSKFRLAHKSANLDAGQLQSDNT